MNANRLAKEAGMVIDKEVEGGEGNGLGEGDAGDIEIDMCHESRTHNLVMGYDSITLFQVDVVLYKTC